MALYDNTDNLYDQNPQRNQYLTSNPTTNPDANTSWMGATGNNQISQAPVQAPISSAEPSAINANQGTMLGSIGSGSFTYDPNSWTGNTGINGGYNPNGSFQQVQPLYPGGLNSPSNYGAAPPGFDANKWNNPSASPNGDSNKYTVGRILAAGGDINQAAAAVGAKVIAPDKIQYPDGFIADVYFDYGGPNQRVQYTDVTGGGDQTNQASMLGLNNSTDPTAMAQFLQRLFTGLQQNRLKRAENPNQFNAATPFNYNSMLGLNPSA